MQLSMRKTKYEILVNSPEGANPYRMGCYRNGTEVGPEDLPRSLRDLEAPLRELLDKFQDAPRQLSIEVSI